MKDFRQRNGALVIAGNNCYTSTSGAGAYKLSALDFGMLRPFLEAWGGKVEIVCLVTPTDRSRSMPAPPGVELSPIAGRLGSRGLGRMMMTPVIAIRLGRKVRAATAAYARLPSPMGTLTLAVSIVLRVPVVCSIHGMPRWRERPTLLQRIFKVDVVYSRMMGALIRRCHVRFATNGEAVAAFGAPGATFTQYRSTLLEELPTMPPIPTFARREVRLVYVGRFSPEKNPLFTFAVAEALSRRGHEVSLELAGSGQMERAVREAAERAEYKVHLHGWLDDHGAVIDLLSRSDFVLIPSHTEGSPKILVEAMALGKPALIRPLNETIRRFGEGGGVMLMKSVTAGDWASSIESACDPDVYSVIAAAGRETARDMTLASLVPEIRGALIAGLENFTERFE